MNPHDELRSLGDALGGLDWVQGPGGNVSVKTDDGELWVKASGARLRDVATPEGHARVPLSLGLAALGGDLAADRALFALAPRPSLETYFHALSGRIVAHTHPVGVGLLACSTRELPPDLAGEVRVIDVAYQRPGRDLALAMESSHDPAAESLVYLLRNHGLVVVASTAARAIALSVMIDERCRGLFGELSPFAPLARSYLDREALTREGALTRALPERRTVQARTPRYLFPDAVVYGSVCYTGEAPPGAKGTWVHEEPSGVRTLYARNRKELDMATEIIASHDWLGEVLEARGCARYLIESEPAAILNLPSEQYRMMVLGHQESN